jgi:hypothetical protein
MAPGGSKSARLAALRSPYEKKHSSCGTGRSNSTLHCAKPHDLFTEYHVIPFTRENRSIFHILLKMATG